MAYGHRPMYPEYFIRKPMNRNLYYLERGNVYGQNGELRARLDDANDLVNYLRDSHSSLFTGTLSMSFAFQFLPGLVHLEQAKVLATPKGKPILVRIRCGHESRWITTCDVWDEVPEVEVLERMWDLYEHAQVGFAPTPSSTGNKTMLKVWETANHKKKQTAPSLACENFLHANSVGGRVWYQLGQYDRAIHLDEKMAYVSQFWLGPGGTAVRVVNGSVNGLATYFCKCKVIIHRELALGPFPMKTQRDHKVKVVYPTLPGVYDVYLWKEEVALCTQAGCTVQIEHGFGWKHFTTCNLPWCQHAFGLRETAHPKHVKTKTKSLAVAGIGHHGMKRERYYLVDESRKDKTDIPVLNDYGEPLEYYVHKEIDNSRAYMVHWNKYTEMKTRVSVYEFALPFAIQGRLVSIDFDSIMILDGDDRHQFIRKVDAEYMACPPGTWLYTLLHNLDITKDRTFESDEMVRKPGVKKDVEAVYC
jgi:hypothetical protein